MIKKDQQKRFSNVRPIQYYAKKGILYQYSTLHCQGLTFS